MKKTRYTLAELAEKFDCKLHGIASICVTDVNSLEEAKEGEISFLANPKYKDMMRRSKASAIINDEKEALSSGFEGKNFLLAKDPSATFQQLIKLLCMEKAPSGFSGIHPTAVIHPSAKVAKNASIGPYAVIDKGVSIGEGSTISSHVYIGAKTTIGCECYIHPHVTIREMCILKNRVILQPGVVIGSCGFGYIVNEKGASEKLEQLGNVILEDDVEIGANTTIDRARFKSTKIGRGSKIDNLVQIAHNVQVGERNLIAAQTGIAGSSLTEEHVMMGGQVGIVGHVTISKGTQIATRGGVNRSLETGVYRGSPVFPIQEYNKQKVHVKRLAKYVKRLEKIEETLGIKENS